MAKFQLGYWNIRGIAQVSRLLAAYVGTELEETRYTEWNKWHGEDKQTLNFDFPNLPYLIDGDFKLTESAAINRYIILQSGHNELLGKTTKDRARVENILGVLKDSLKEIRSLFMNKEFATLKDAALEKVKTKFDLIQAFIGDKKFALGYLTIVDFEIAESSYYIAALYPKEYSKWSFWQTIRENFNELPQIEAYYHSEKALSEPFLPPQMASINPKFKTTITLGYWGIRGLAQPVRHLLSYLGLPFEEKLYTSAQAWFDTDKNNIGLDFPNIPYLIDGDFKLSESIAVLKYAIGISHHKELLGKNIHDTVKIQSVIGVLNDVFAEISKNFFVKTEQTVKQTVERITPKLNNLAKFVGERKTVLQYLTLADFLFAQRSHYIETLLPEESKKWGFLARIRHNINGLASTKAYYAREGAIKGPFMPPTFLINPSYEEYK